MPEQSVAQWLSAVDFRVVRRAQLVCDATTESGSHLRAVRLASDLYLGRGRQFYRLPDEAGARAIPIPVEQVPYTAVQLTALLRAALTITAKSRRLRAQ
jgi:hypothetical protein